MMIMMMLVLYIDGSFFYQADEAVRGGTLSGVSTIYLSMYLSISLREIFIPFFRYKNYVQLTKQGPLYIKIFLIHFIQVSTESFLSITVQMYLHKK